MQLTLEMIDRVAAVIRTKIKIQPRIGLILGTGLGGLAEAIQQPVIIPYSELPGWPVSTVQGHTGRLVLGELDGQRLMVMQGRIHYYEGYDMAQVTLPVRVMQRLGIEILIVTNAAGAINPDFMPGDVMLITDHLNLVGMTGLNPLIGLNLDELGPRFPDMSQAYDRGLCELARKVARDNKLILHEGVYVGLSGPSFESPADLRFLCLAGADSVGMSTVPEVIVANHMDLPCAAISVLTDECDPDNLKPVSLAEILRVAGLAEEQLIRLFSRLMQNI